MSDNTKLSKDGLNQVWLKAMTILKSLTGNVRTDKGTLQEQIDKLEENASSGVDLTQAEYDALPDSKETDGVDYYITDEDFVATDAKAVGYDNTASGLAAKTVQVAIDEVCENAFGGINESKSEEALTRQTLGYSKKNLLPYPYFENTKTASGVSFTVNNDGSITVNGTATDNVFFNIVYKSSDLKLDVGRKYILSGLANVFVSLRLLDNSFNSVEVFDCSYTKDSITFAPTKEYMYVTCYIYVSNGTTIDNVTIHPMLRDASITDDTYEIYTPNIKDIVKNITNPNLLDNPWFTVNQRGVTEYATNSYGVDRWYVGANGTRKFTICSNGIKIESTSPNISNNTFYQNFLAKELGLGGKTVTISAMVAEASEGALLDLGLRKGRNEGGTADWSAIGRKTSIPVRAGDIVSMTCNIPEDCNDILIFDVELANTAQPIGTYVIIRAVKLEVGSISTLALDAAPNYQQELAKCQRYYQRYNGAKIALFGYAFGTSGARIYFPGIDMRDTPKVSFNNLILYRNGINTLDNTAGIKSVGGIINHSGIKSVVITSETNIFEMGDIVMLANKTDAENPYIDFSADL